MGLTVGSLFSGIGGLDLGLEWAGFETKWFCEIEKFPQAVLRKHWPDTPIIEDVRNVTKGNVQHVDVIAGGFPCQDISWAGIGRGIDYDLSEQEGTRSGLWWEMWRVIRELRPRYVIAENVPALTHRGLDIVLGSLAQIGYDAEWQTISAAGVGAPHIRERVFIVAYPSGKRCEAIGWAEPSNKEQHNRGDAQMEGGPSWFAGPIGQPWPVSFKMGNAASESGDGGRLYKINGCQSSEPKLGDTSGKDNVVNTERGGSGCRWEQQQESGKKKRGAPKRVQWVEAEYDFRGVAYGVSDRVGALKGYGNAVVPQVGYLVGRAVREHAEENGWWQ